VIKVKTTNKRTTRIPIVPPKGSRDERKELLQESVNKYLEAIETQIGDLKKVGKNTLVIGGVIVAAYALTELLLPDATPKRNRMNGNVLPSNVLPSNVLPSNVLPSNVLPIVVEEGQEEESMLWTALKGAAMSLLLTIAKDKILELMENMTTNNAEFNS
jgi:hypothetical protein